MTTSRDRSQNVHIIAQGLFSRFFFGGEGEEGEGEGEGRERSILERIHCLSCMGTRSDAENGGLGKNSAETFPLSNFSVKTIM